MYFDFKTQTSHLIELKKNRSYSINVEMYNN